MPHRLLALSPATCGMVFGGKLCCMLLVGCFAYSMVLVGLEFVWSIFRKVVLPLMSGLV